ncbi:MAG: hypothetical protein ACRELF_20095, partial [Gemmataceae bacterium]
MIRFCCPRCQSVLMGQAEQAGKLMTCPRCGQKMIVPLGALTQPRSPRPQSRQPTTPKTSRRWLGLVMAMTGLLLLTGAAGGVWLLIRSDSKETTSPDRVASSQPVASTPTNPPNPETTNEPKLPQQTKPSEEPSPPTRPPETKPPVTNPPVVAESPPSLPPQLEKKDIELADELSPDLTFEIVDAVNAARVKRGRDSIFLDAERSRPCQQLAERLARLASPNGDRPPPDNVVATSAPLEAVAKWLQEPARRAAILEPRLRSFAVGFARNVKGQWVSVFDWNSGIDREPPMATTPITGALVYPAPGQTRVPLWFPGNEVPDPLPDTKDKVAGYPVTITFPPRQHPKEVTAHLSNKKQRDIDVWLSTPDKPANPHFIPH